MKKTLLNRQNLNVNEIREQLNKHFSSYDTFRNEKFSSIEEALIEGYKTAINQELEKEEKRSLLVKASNTIIYFVNQGKYTLSLEHKLIYRNILVGLHNTRRENENYIFVLLNFSFKILLDCENKDKEQFSFIASDTLFYLMDYVLDSRVYTSSEDEVNLITSFFLLIERGLKDELKNLKESNELALILDLFLTMGAYFYINGQDSLFDSRKDLICAGILNVETSNYPSKIATAYVASMNFNRYNNYPLKDKIETKKKELKGGLN